VFSQSQIDEVIENESGYLYSPLLDRSLFLHVVVQIDGAKRMVLSRDTLNSNIGSGFVTIPGLNPMAFNSHAFSGPGGAAAWAALGGLLGLAGINMGLPGTGCQQPSGGFGPCCVTDFWFLDEGPLTAVLSARAGYSGGALGAISITTGPPNKRQASYGYGFDTYITLTDHSDAENCYLAREAGRLDWQAARTNGPAEQGFNPPKVNDGPAEFNVDRLRTRIIVYDPPAAHFYDELQNGTTVALIWDWLRWSVDFRLNVYDRTDDARIAWVEYNVQYKFDFPGQNPPVVKAGRVVERNRKTSPCS
jgi:hypothetical protein